MMEVKLRDSPQRLRMSVRLIRGICHPVRIRVLAFLLEHGTLSVKDLQLATGLGQSNVSQHLKKLQAAGLIGMEKVGSFNHYRISHPGIKTLLEQAAHCVEAMPEYGNTGLNRRPVPK